MSSVIDRTERKLSAAAAPALPWAAVEFDPRTVLGDATRFVERLGDEAYFAGVCLRAGLIGPMAPQRYAKIGLALERYGLLGGALSSAAIQHGHQLAVIDELGELTYGELNARVDAIATGWRERGLSTGDGVAIAARNHRGLLEAFFAAAKCGARVILLNTAFAGRQIREVAEREGADLLVHDDEYAAGLNDFVPRLGRWRAWVDGPGEAAEDSLEALIARTAARVPPRPGRWPQVVILTSGTTGAPRGARREVPLSLLPIGGLLSRVPLRSRQVTHLCAPVFHAFGFTNMILGVALGSTLVLERRFDPMRVLDSLEYNRASAMIAVPVMLQRLLAVDEEAWTGRDLSALRIVFVSGSQLSAELARQGARRLGPVLYNLYGSTEIAYATIATPEDLRAAPGCAGRVVRGTVVKILDEAGEELPTGRSGRIFVGNSIQFEGYTGGGAKEQVGGLMSSGDVGHFDADGRLFIDGRDDEMIISGGENVFPGEVEELLGAHEAVVEAAVVGVEDERFGQRLKAFVVRQPGVELTEDEVREYVRENLARYKVPREVVFLDELPRNATGKILKRELSAQPGAVRPSC